MAVSIIQNGLHPVKVGATRKERIMMNAGKAFHTLLYLYCAVMAAGSMRMPGPMVLLMASPFR
jgi:hypothetical protein